jgi:DivIVA domain-containing protein
VTGRADDHPAARPMQRLSPERVRSTHFSRTAIGRRGLNEDEVALFLHRVAEDLAARDAAEATLRANIAHYKDTLQRWQHEQHEARFDHGHDAAMGGRGPTVEAVNVLSRAQQEADAYVAQAEEYCRRLAADARDHAQEILDDAQARAGAAARAAVDDYRERAGDDHTAAAEDLARRLAWARTFVASLETVETQLRTAREALGHELDRMDQPSGLPLQRR